MNSIETTRFGTVEITEEHLIHFEDGIIGFHNLHTYVLVESPTVPLILWLQSVDAPEIAFPVAEPWFFRRDYKAPLNEADRHSLKLEANENSKLFVILTIPEDMTRMTVNLRAPLVLNLSKSTGTQMILQDKSLEVRSPAHEAFSKALASYNQSQASMAQFNEDDGDEWLAVNVRGAEPSAEAK